MNNSPNSNSRFWISDEEMCLLWHDRAEAFAAMFDVVERDELRCATLVDVRAAHRGSDE